MTKLDIQGQKDKERKKKDRNMTEEDKVRPVDLGEWSHSMKINWQALASDQVV